MVGKWLVVLPLLVDLNKVGTQPVTEEDSLRRPRQLDVGDCCPCPKPDKINRFINQEESADIDGTLNNNCSCETRKGDAEASPSILSPTLRAFQPLENQSNSKSEPKPLLQPEVGLASSVLETLRQVTDEEYQDALARDAARSVVQLIDSDVISSLSNTMLDMPKNVVRDIVNYNEDEMNDNLPQPSHIQETRCIHSPMEKFEDIRQLRMNQPPTIIEVFSSPRKPLKKIKNKKLLHRNLFEMDSSLGASNVQERVLLSRTDNNLQGDLKTTSFSSNLFPQFSELAKKNNDMINAFGSKLEERNNRMKALGSLPIMRQNIKPIIHVEQKKGVKADNDHYEKRKEKINVPNLDIQKYFPSPTRLPSLQPTDGSLLRLKRPFGLQDLLKLKDVELIPPKDLEDKVTKGRLYYSNFKPPTSLTLKNINKETNIREIGNTYMEPITSRNVNQLISSEVVDSFTSPTNSEPKFDIENNESDLNKEFTKNGPISSFSNDNISNEENPNKCINVQGSPDRSVIFTNTEALIDHYTNENFSNNHLKYTPSDKNQVLNEKRFPSKEDHDIDRGFSTSGETDANVYQIELIGDEDLMVKFDKSSIEITTKADITDNNNVDKVQSNFQAMLKGNVADDDNHNMQLPQKCDTTSLENIAIDSSPKVEGSEIVDIPTNYNNNILLRNPGTINVRPNIVRKNLSPRTSVNSQKVTESINIKDINSDQHSKLRAVSVLSNSNMRDVSNDESVHSDKISLQDLQEMSDSILNQSECKHFNNEDTDIDVSNEMNVDNMKMPNNEFFTIPERIPEENKIMEMQDAGMQNPFLNSNDEHMDITDHDIKDDECATLFTSDIMQPNNFKDSFVNSDNEISSAPMGSDSTFSQINLKSCEPESTLLENILQTRYLDSNSNSKVLKNNDEVSESMFENRHTNILENLKSKVENLFSTPEHDNDISSTDVDNINESSNMNPVITGFDSQTDLNKFQRTAFEIPEYGINKRKNKLTIPKSLEKSVNLQPTLSTIPLYQPTGDRRKIGKNNNQYKTELLTNDAPNFFMSPLDLTRPEDVIDAGLALNDLSQKLKTHTENTIQNLKDTLESRLKEVPIVGLRKSNDNIEARAVLDRLSNRNNELSDKLHALHSDFNDRLNSLHLSISEGLNQPFPRNFELPENSGGVWENSIPFNHAPLFVESKTKHNDDNKNLAIVLPRTVNISNDNDSREKTSKNILRGGSRVHNVQKIIPALRQGSDILQSNRNSIDRKPQISKPTIKFTTTTPKSNFITRTNILKDTEDQTKYLTASPTNILKSKIPVPIEGHKLKSKPYLHKPDLRKIFEGHTHKSPTQTSPSRTSLPYKPNTSYSIRKSSTDKSSEESSTKPVESNLKNMLQRNKKTNSRSDIRNPLSNFMKNVDANGIKKINRSDTNLDRSNDSDFTMDASHSATENIENMRLVEPLRENVPYKCKLICYKNK